MAKGKNLNPADAYRKAQRKKELKKNKTERIKARDFALVKKDTWDIEDEIAKLDAAGEKPETSSRLADLKAELEKINRKKAEYVAEHPEQRRLVYRPRKKDGDKAEEEPVLLKRNLFDKNGLPRHPERSVYYDPVMNPFGVPPPGMPFMQRPPLPGEVWSDDEDTDEDEIPMPKGRPPGLNVEGEDSDDDIPMPEGPPPGQFPLVSPIPPPSVPFPPSEPAPSAAGAPPPLPPGPPPQNLIPPLGAPGGTLPPPPSSMGANIPPPPLGLPYPPPPPPPPGMSYSIPPMPHGFPNFPPGLPLHHLPPPPPGFYPKRNQSASSMQDPLSSIPHKTFQAHRDQTNTSAHPSLPPNPMRNPVGLPSSSSLPQRPITDKTGVELGAATVSAAPQLRDFKKEATAFIPTALKRKKPGASVLANVRVDAAPSLDPGMDAENPEIIAPARPDLLSTLKDRFGPAPPVAEVTPSKKRKVETERKDDYEKFVEDVLGTAK